MAGERIEVAPGVAATCASASIRRAKAMLSLVSFETSQKA